MRMSTRAVERVVILLYFLCAIVLHTLHVSAYEIETHATISEKAVDNSSLDQLVPESGGVCGGKREVFNGKTVLDWVKFGSQAEDASFRFFRHFHDPLRNWNSSGFGVEPLRAQ